MLAQRHCNGVDPMGRHWGLEKIAGVTCNLHSFYTLLSFTACILSQLAQLQHTGCFFSLVPPLKSSKYTKVNLG